MHLPSKAANCCCSYTTFYHLITVEKKKRLDGYYHCSLKAKIYRISNCVWSIVLSNFQALPLNLHPGGVPASEFASLFSTYCLNDRHFSSVKWSNAFCMCVCVPSHFSHVWLCVTRWILARQASLSVGWILQARMLEWVAISSSRGCAQPRDRTCVSYVSCIRRQVLYK